MDRISTIPLDSGSVLVAERVPGVASAAMSWYLPLGSATDPADSDGYSAMLSELVFRGAGALDSRGLSDAFDRIGVQRTSQVLRHHILLSTTMLGRCVDDAVTLIADIVRRPALPADAVEPVRSLCLQSLEALDDDPQHQVMLELRAHHLPAPYNRNGYGREDVLRAADAASLRASWEQRSRPDGTIIAAAGAVDPPALAARLNELLAGWTGAPPPLAPAGSPTRGCHHLTHETSQVHIAMAYDAPVEADPSSMLERLAVSVLGGSTSGRLFTEVRQKRSLCYSVGASYRAGRDLGSVTVYAGTTPQRAAETLEVCRAEIGRMREGIDAEEFARAAVGLKSRLIMQGESTPARASMLATDQFRLGRVRGLDDIARAIDAVSLEELNAYLAARDPGPMTIATIGPEPLESSTAEEASSSPVAGDAVR